MSILDPYRLYIEAGVAVIAAAAIVTLWVKHDHEQQAIGAAKVVAADAAAVKRQAAIDDAKLKAAGDAHDKELAAIAALDTGGGAFSVRCYSSGGVPTPAVHGDTGPAAAVVQQDAGVHPDITGALRVLAKRADILAADARELNAEVH